MKLGKQPELFESGVFDLPGAFYMDFCIMENNVNIQIPKNQAIICICRQWDVTNTLLTNYKITFFTILYLFEKYCPTKVQMTFKIAFHAGLKTKKKQPIKYRTAFLWWEHGDSNPGLPACDAESIPHYERKCR